MVMIYHRIQVISQKEVCIDLQWLHRPRGQVDTKHTGTRQLVSEEWSIWPYHFSPISVDPWLWVSFSHWSLKGAFVFLMRAFYMDIATLLERPCTCVWSHPAMTVAHQFYFRYYICSCMTNIQPQYPSMFIDVFPIDVNVDVSLVTFPVETQLDEQTLSLKLQRPSPK